MSRATDAYQRLHNAMMTTRPECEGIALFTSDDLNKYDMAALKPLCDTCPLLELCGDYARTANPPTGYWAGRRFPLRAGRKKVL